MTTLSLRALRQYAGQTQVEAARSARTTQSELSRLERRDDLLLSTLQAYVRALGGAVEVRVELGSTTFTLEQAPPPPPDAADVARAIDTLASLREWLPTLVAPLSAKQARERRAGLGEFSVVEHVCHLRDLDVEAYARRLAALRRGPDNPSLPDFDGTRAAHERRYQEQALAKAQQALLAAREVNVRALRRLTPAQLKRSGTLEGVGAISLGGLITRWAGHDVGHRVELERLAAALA